MSADPYEIGMRGLEKKPEWYVVKWRDNKHGSPLFRHREDAEKEKKRLERQFPNRGPFWVVRLKDD